MLCYFLIPLENAPIGNTDRQDEELKFHELIVNA